MGLIHEAIQSHRSSWRFQHARNIVFPPALGVDGFQQPLSDDDGTDISTGSEFYGLTTFANLPYANCFTDSKDDESLEADIYILGAPFDTVSAPS